MTSTPSALFPVWLYYLRSWSALWLVSLWTMQIGMFSCQDVGDNLSIASSAPRSPVSVVHNVPYRPRSCCRFCAAWPQFCIRRSFYFAFPPQSYVPSLWSVTGVVSLISYQYQPCVHYCTQLDSPTIAVIQCSRKNPMTLINPTPLFGFNLTHPKWSSSGLAHDVIE